MGASWPRRGAKPNPNPHPHPHPHPNPHPNPYLGDHLGDARPVETLLRPLVAAAQHLVEVNVEVLRHRVHGEQREEQVDVDLLRVRVRVRVRVSG